MEERLIIMETVAVTFAGKITAIPGRNPQTMYEHQSDAIGELKKVNKSGAFAGLVVIPTGGGKTGTAVRWLLQEAVDNRKKVLWIAHRHLLLEQAAESFQKYAYSEILINKKEFTYRIISGKHDIPINIKITDDVLIVSKDSLTRNLSTIDDWLKGQEEIYFVIDEAHHATAKTYRKIINYLMSKCSIVKMLGLTATPFRTAEEEKGLLGQIFTDGIIYKIDLKELINRGILSRPEFEECRTHILFAGELGKKDLESINQLDALPEKIVQEISNNRVRNKAIVDRYEEFHERYEQTLIFALSRTHAIALKSLFHDRGIEAEFIISGTQAEFTGITVSNEENERNLDKFRRKEISVLINVNILTEGADLPQTKTVFLTRPTVSTILMTQMIGRALRGEKAGGTKDAYIVSFVDDWEEHIAWANPSSLLCEGDFIEPKVKVNKNELQLISIAKIEEFARILDETVDSSELEGLDFMSRVPIGMYAFSFLDAEVERNYQVLIYDSTKEQYENFISDLPDIMKEYDVEDEVIPELLLQEIAEDTEHGYFNPFMLPTYDCNDIIAILKYYAQNEIEPRFIPFDEIDRKKLDLAEIAQTIDSKDLKRSEEKAYLDSLWNAEDGIIRIYFGKRMYFKRQLEIEFEKLSGDFNVNAKPNVVLEERELSKFSLFDIAKHDTASALIMKNTVYENSRKNGLYTCAICGYQSKLVGKFQVDHIKPRAKGGKTELDNLQLLCTPCNKRKSDKEITNDN